MKGHSHFISSLSLSNDLKSVASSSWDKTIRLWDLTTSKTKTIFQGHNKDVLSVAFTGTNKRMLVSGSMDNTIKVWNANREVKQTLIESAGWVSCLKSIKVGKDNMLAAGSWDCNVRLYNDEFEQIRVFQNDYAISSMAASNDGEFLFVAEIKDQ
jgi:guanine nucleotide-binding protein subunit beta-2-like 1 protein